MATAKQPVVFIHIPKTGGSSVHQFLKDSLPDYKLCPARFYPELHNCTDEEIGSTELFSGHFGIEDCKRIEKISQPKYITVVRDPVERVISLYTYWRAQEDGYKGTPGTDPFHAGVQHALRSSTLDEFLCTDDPAVLATISNTHCRFIASTPDKHRSIGDALPHYFFTQAVRQLKKHFAWYGTMADLNKNPGALWECLGIVPSHQLAMPTLNTTPSSHRNTTVSEAARKKIIALNEADINLYHYLLKHPISSHATPLQTIASKFAMQRT